MKAVIIGAGGFGREVLNWLPGSIHDTNSGNIELLGLLDDGNPDPTLLTRLGATHLGGVDWLEGRADVIFYVAVGHPAARRSLVSRAQALGGHPAPPLVHGSAVVGRDVTLGPGTIRSGPGQSSARTRA